MFTIRFAPDVCMGYPTATAQAATLRGAIAFAGEFAPNQCGVLASAWIDRGGRQIIEIYDWCDCWFLGSTPVLAEVEATETAAE